jgi:amino acid transporter
MMVLAAIQVAILLAFALSGLLSPGPGGISATPLQEDPKYGIGGMAVGVVFAIFAFTGFEAVVPMAEETTNPRQNLPIAIVVSLLLMGVFYVVASYGLVIGWGTQTFDTTFAGKDAGAFMDLAQRLWGAGWVLLLVALLISAFAVGISAANASTRVLFSMGRGGALPKWLGDIHPTYRTPKNAVLLQTLITIIVAYGGGFLIGPDKLFFWLGIVITLGMIGVYGLGNLGVINYYLTERRDEFSWFWHLVIPLISTGAILVVGYQSLQGLSGIYSWAPWAVLGWLVLGIVILAYARARGHEDWLIKAGEVAFERQASSEEIPGTL